MTENTVYGKGQGLQVLYLKDNSVINVLLVKGCYSVLKFVNDIASYAYNFVKDTTCDRKIHQINVFGADDDGLFCYLSHI